MKMNHYPVKYSKAQMKIQQMAFMLVAVMIFFAMVAIVYFMISVNSARSQAAELRDKEARELVRQLAATPELAFTAAGDCAQCIDLDKAFALTQSSAAEEYKRMWNVDYIMIEKIYPGGFASAGGEVKCLPNNYPSCNELTILDGQEYATKTAFVTLAHWDRSLNGGNGYWVYELGRIHASAKSIS